eukprot:scaffold3845_cov20-Tisochrysis_lutea.AAC.1
MLHFDSSGARCSATFLPLIFLGGALGTHASSRVCCALPLAIGDWLGGEPCGPPPPGAAGAELGGAYAGLGQWQQRRLGLLPIWCNATGPA